MTQTEIAREKRKEYDRRYRQKKRRGKYYKSKVPLVKFSIPEKKCPKCGITDAGHKHLSVVEYKRRKKREVPLSTGAKLLQEVLILDDNICWGCGEWTEFPPHHIKYKSHGGLDILENIMTLCAKCHHLAHHGGRIKGVWVSAYKFVLGILNRKRNHPRYRFHESHEYIESRAVR